MQRLDLLLRLHFALLAAFGGLLLGFSEQAGALPVIAVFSSAFAFVFVDWLKWFSLPTVVGYILMGLIAAYCIGEFIPLTPANNRQLMAVAQLLVLVQAVLMLQHKTRRTFEQIGVFCLLEIVVAAVFNQALAFVMLFIPIALLGLSALTLLQVHTVSQPLQLAFPGGTTAKPKNGFWGQAASPSTVVQFARAGRRLPVVVIGLLGPAVLLVGLAFFYVLPRTVESDGVSLGLAPQVGFSDSIELNQIGKLQADKSIVMRVKLEDAMTEKPYHAVEPLYLRGQTLDHYDFTELTGRWRATRMPRFLKSQRLPREYFPDRSTDSLFYDRVNVTVYQQPQSTNVAFAIAPYYDIAGESEVRHNLERWLLFRDTNESNAARTRAEYRYGTHAFNNGLSTPWLRSFAPGEEAYLPRSPLDENLSLWRRQEARFNNRHLKEVQRRARQVVEAMPEKDRTPAKIANRLAEYVTNEAGLRYTLDLTMKRDRRRDPVEEFLTQNRAGNCTYFASLLALMLRSQNIPSRLVVGYKTEEFNPYSQQYVVRQSHAHAWVEAYLTGDQIPDSKFLLGQLPVGPAWLRLDPTPSASGNNQSQVTQAFDHVQNVFETWFLHRDSEQEGDVLGQSGISGTFSLLFRRIALRIRQFATGEPPPGLSARKLFSWPAAVASVLLATIAVTFWRFLQRRPPPILMGRAVSSGQVAVTPQLDFYREMLQLLEPLDWRRSVTQTPAEFAGRAPAPLKSPQWQPLRKSVDELTQLYYSLRFGGLGMNEEVSAGIQEQLQQVRQMVQQHRPARETRT